MEENRNKHRLNAADIITLLRIAGTVLLVALKPLSAEFFIIYALTGLTDALDGWIARKTKTAGNFGARLDSIADLLFYAVILIRVLPFLSVILPDEIWYFAAAVFCIRISAYITAAVKYRLFASLHTYLNKFTGIAVFLIPFFVITEYTAEYCWAVCAVAAAASLEELVIYLSSKAYCSNIKSILQKRRM